MLLSVFFGVPWWVWPVFYFSVGFLWAILYLPRSVARKAEAYAVWRRAKLGDGPVESVLVAGEAKKGKVNVKDFLSRRERAGFSEQSIVKRFIFDIACWPISILERLLTDFLVALWRRLEQFFTWLWERVLSRLFDWLCEALEWTWRQLCSLMADIGRAIRWVWENILRRPAQWVYEHCIGIYRRIIQLANREAIADLDKLSASHKESTE